MQELTAQAVPDGRRVENSVFINGIRHRDLPPLLEHLSDAGDRVKLLKVPVKQNEGIVVR